MGSHYRLCYTERNCKRLLVADDANKDIKLTYRGLAAQILASALRHPDVSSKQQIAQLDIES